MRNVASQVGFFHKVIIKYKEMLEAGPLVIEWADQIKDALPEEKLIIELEWIEQENRQMRVHAVGERYNLLLSNFQKSIFGGD